MRTQLSYALALSAVALFIPTTAKATGAYDFSCGNSGVPCVYAQNDGTSGAIQTLCTNTQPVNGVISCIVAGGSGNTIGLSAVGDNNSAIHATYNGAIGIAAVSVNGGQSNGIGASNYRTDWNAAVIGASPGNSNGLAFYSAGQVSKPGGGPWAGNSDERVKKEVKDFNVGLSALLKMHPVTYKYNGLAGTQDDGNEFVGVIAQELEKIVPGVPNMVQTHPRKLRPTDAQDTDLRVVDPNAFTFILINAVREQQRIIDDQKARIVRLERARAPLNVSSLVGGFGALGALAFVPVGMFFARRRRQDRD